MRLFVRAVLGVVGAVAVVAGALWAVLPALAAPVGRAPVLPPLEVSALAGDVRSSAGGLQSLTLPADALDGVLESWAASAGLAGAWVTLGQGRADLHVDTMAPPFVPVLGGHPVGLEVMMAPTVAQGGILTLTVKHVRVGRISADALVPVPTLVRWAAAHAGPAHPWWHVEGPSVAIDLKTAPPIPLGQFALRLTPSSVEVSPAALVVTGSADALVRMDAASLSSALAGALQAQAAPVAATVRLQQGRAILSLVGPTGARTDVALTPSVPHSGVLRVAVAGPAGAAANVAQLLEGDGGGSPSWLIVDGGGLTVDFRRMDPIEVAQGLRLRLLPESVQVDPTLLQGWLTVQPA